MQNVKNRTMATLIALFLLSTIAVVALPAANAHTPPWQIPTFAYIVVSPNPIGVGQPAAVVFWLDKVLPSASLTNDIRMKNYKLTITAPDGTTETMNWPSITDTTSSQYTHYTPSQIGTYTFKFEYLGQTYTWSGTYQNDTYLPSTASTTLTVQQEPIPTPENSYPLPTEYWTRPIEGQNTYWYTIASNWLGTGSPQWSGGGKVQPDGIAPNSPHVMWTKPIQDGGVVGGSNTAIPGNMFYTGLSYNQRFTNAIIMSGKLFYQLPYGNSGGGGGYVAVDLRTGEQLWWTNTTGIGVPSFGYLYSYEYPNQHGVIPSGWLFTSNFARAYDPTTGIPETLNITDVPSGTGALGPSGEILRYAVTNIGNTTNPNWRLTQWNSSKVFTTQTSGTINASLASRYDWNVSIPSLPGLSSPSIIQAVPDDLVFGRSSTFLATSSSSTYGTPNPYTFWAISLKPASLGQLMWIKNYTPPTGPSGYNVTLLQGPANPKTRVFTMYEKETMQWYGYSLDDGSPLWGPTPPSQYEYNYYDALESISVNCPIVYDRLYYAGYGGVLYCYDAKNGSLLWTYGNGGPGNSTNSGLETIWGSYPIWISAVADGKLYLYSSEHSPNTPIYKDALIRCIDAYTGKEIWTLMGFGGMFGPSTQMFEAEGFLVYLNSYDMQIYCIGKGPSATTVQAPLIAITAGDSVVIQGTVTDICAGTKQNEQAARFPNGVPAVSDASMRGWMEYVYMQKPYPSNATGVQVSIDAVDPNGNFIHIGTVTSETSGLFHYAWKTPDVPGEYTVTATFAGSESYWPSYAQTAMVISEALPATPPPAQPQPAPDPTLTIIGTGIAIIIAVAIAAIWIKKK